MVPHPFKTHPSHYSWQLGTSSTVPRCQKQFPCVLEEVLEPGWQRLTEHTNRIQRALSKVTQFGLGIGLIYRTRTKLIYPLFPQKHARYCMNNYICYGNTLKRPTLLETFFVTLNMTCMQNKVTVEKSLMHSWFLYSESKTILRARHTSAVTPISMDNLLGHATLAN